MSRDNLRRHQRQRIKRLESELRILNSERRNQQLVMAALVHRLGGSVVVSESDMEAIVRTKVEAEGCDGGLRLEIVRPKKGIMPDVMCPWCGQPREDHEVECDGDWPGPLA